MDDIDKDALKRAFAAARRVGGSWLTIGATETAILAYLTAMEAKRKSALSVANDIIDFWVLDGARPDRLKDFIISAIKADRGEKP